MTILEEILEKIKDSPELEQVRILCDTIFDEEKDKMEYIEFRPKGPNVFLSLQVEGRHENEIGFLNLERETNKKWVVVYKTLSLEIINSENAERRYMHRSVWNINEEKPEKILTEYAKVIKYLKGE